MAFVFALGVFVGVDSGVALAHNTFVESSPANGEVLTTVPTSWSVTFTKSVPLSSASAEVVNGDGVRTALGKPVHGSSDTTVVFTLPANLSGKVTGRWRLVGSDGHIITGRVSFTVQGAPVPDVTTTVPTIPGVTVPQGGSTVDTTDDLISDSGGSVGTFSEPVRVVVRTVGYLGIFLLGGLFFAEWYIAQGSFTTKNGRFLLRIGALCLAVGPLIQYAIFLSDSRGFGGTYAGAFANSFTLSFGIALLLRCGTGIAIAIYVYKVMQHGLHNIQRRAGAALLAAVHLVSLAVAGHSRTEALPWLGVPTNVLHLAGSVVWLGGLVAVIFVVAPAVSPAEGVVAFDRFGYAAERAVGVVAITGVIQSLRLHGDVVSLFTSLHGVLLLIKVVLVLAIIRHAAHNRRVLDRNRAADLSRPSATRTVLVQAALTETALGVAVVGITSILVGISPS